MTKDELEDVMLNTRSLFMVDVRFYDINSGIEVEREELIAKAIVLKVNKDYFNAIIGERYPYIEGYGQRKDSYISFGRIKNKELMKEKGICYVKTNSSFMDELKRKEQISMRELEDKILNSNIYFKDRVYIAESRIKLNQRKIKFPNKIKMLRIINSDNYKNNHFKRKLNEIMEQKEYKKASI